MASTVTIDDKRWNTIRQFIVELAAGKFELPEFMPEHGDELDGIIQGIVMVSEELKTSSVSRAYLDSVIAGITDILMVLDEDLKVVEYNLTAQKFFRVDDKELINKDFTQLVKGGNDILAAIESVVVKTKGKMENVQIELVSPSKHCIPFSISVSHISSINNPRHRVLVVAKDVSDLIETQKRLEESNKELSTLIYRLSHDIRSPLANILGLSDLMFGYAESLDEDDSLIYSNLLEKLTFSARRIDSILHYFNRLSVIQSELKTEDVSLVSLFENLEIEIKDKFEDVEVEFNVVLDTDEVLINCSRLLLSIILLQVLENCFVYRKPDERLKIDIQAKRTDYDIAVTIGDNGIGITESLKPKVFNMLVKGHNDSDRTGMGLFFVKTALNQIMGKVELESTEGVGTALTLRLPIAKKKKQVVEV